MKNLLLLVSISGILFTGCSHEQQAGSEQIPLLPYPRELILMEGQFHPSDAVTLRASGLTEESDPVLFSQLDQSIYEAYGIKVVTEETEMPDIWIGLPETDITLKTLCEQESIWPTEEIGEEGYVLKITGNRILLASNTNQGLFYGVQTLRQLFREFTEKPGIPAMMICDWPGIPVRAIMDDISRGPIPSNVYIKDQIRRYSELKINHMSFYIEHVVRTEKHPGFAPSDGALSIEEFRELSEYASSYHIKLIGSFQSL
ncbi:MAG: beta-N-acetylhexosaminidase, partial [Bacteroidales bacterium]|nr:beta-N-acetylhexosaminidase [Bacteroidales bacterium]